MSEQASAAGALWGGRFSGGPAESVAALSRSIHFDWRLAKYDILGTKAHIRALQHAGYLTFAEMDKLDKDLTELWNRIQSGSFTAKPADEDVHSALERGLIEITGKELGGKVRAGRSRNDQIATLIRIYLLEEATHLEKLVRELIGTISNRAEEPWCCNAGSHALPARAARSSFALAPGTRLAAFPRPGASQRLAQARHAFPLRRGCPCR